MLYQSSFNLYQTLDSSLISLPFHTSVFSLKPLPSMIIQSFIIFLTEGFFFLGSVLLYKFGSLGETLWPSGYKEGREEQTEFSLKAQLEPWRHRSMVNEQSHFMLCYSFTWQLWEFQSVILRLDFNRLKGDSQKDCCPLRVWRLIHHLYHNCYDEVERPV